MDYQQDMTRRSWLQATGMSAGLAAAGSLTAGARPAYGAKRKAGKLSFQNEDFYRKGKFDMEAAKDGIVELMKHHDYPVFDNTRDLLWISDYGLGEFARVGLAAILFFNQEAEHVGDRFMLLDIYLLPNQMLPEHYHLGTAKARPKMEAWIVRNGLSYIVGEGDPTPGLKEMMPESQKDHVTVWHAVKAGPGGKAELNRPEARHWQLAGPEGVILSEVANYHDNEGVGHTNPNIVFP